MVSAKTRYNVRHLCQLIYSTCYSVFSSASTGSKLRLLEQKIPASYIALEEVPTYLPTRCLLRWLLCMPVTYVCGVVVVSQIVCSLADERKQKGKDPVLTGDQYRSTVQEQMLKRYGKTFRDLAELNQATAFLHENGGSLLPYPSLPFYCRRRGTQQLRLFLQASCCITTTRL